MKKMKIPSGLIIEKEMNYVKVAFKILPHVEKDVTGYLFFLCHMLSTLNKRTSHMTKPLAKIERNASVVACETSALNNFMMKAADIECLCSGTNQGEKLNHIGS